MTQMQPSSFRLFLPAWINACFAFPVPSYRTAEKRMQLVIDCARRNVEEETGGPFAAAVFNVETNELIALGVNRVTLTNCSTAHAEIMALSLAQQKLQTYDLGAPGISDHELVVNWCPCAMCFGAVLWSGIRRLTIAGSGPELEELTGFDEGPLPLRWRSELEKRGIAVQEGVLRERAIELFRWFATTGSPVYNARQG